MQEYITSYLFQNRSCPLPGLGNLIVHSKGAVTDFSNKVIHAPVSFIQFEPGDADAAPFLSWLSKQIHAGDPVVRNYFSGYCLGLKNELSAHSTARLGDLGELYVDETGHVGFRPEVLPASFSPSVSAERVIHPDAEHNMLVGDKETTNTAMAGFLAHAPVLSNRWWIWAIVLGVIALAAIAFYYSGEHVGGHFGNTLKI